MITFQFNCGPIKGKARGKSAGSAFRKLMRAQKRGRKDFAPLARFRILLFYKSSPWFYQDPEFLLRSK